MKKNSLYIICMLFCCLCSCKDDWDEHYSAGDQQVNDETVMIVDQKALEYVSSTTGLEKMYRLLKSTGIESRMEAKNQEFTLLVYPDEVLEQAGIKNQKDSLYFAQTCICDLAYVPTKFVEGSRLLMWNGKYLTVTLEKEAPENKGNKGLGIYLNGSEITKIVKVNNGYVYELNAPIHAPKSMYETLQDLDDNYSLFKNMVLSQDSSVFDAANSTPVGVDKSGNTIYDSVWVTTNPLFEKLNIMSESISGTMFIPSNEVLTEYFKDAYENKILATRNIATLADTLKYTDWAWQAMFYEDKITPEIYNAGEDLKSVYSKQWRPSVQEIDLSNPVQLSNGVAYYVNKLKLPMNQIIYRFKEYFKYWENCTPEQQDEFFKWENIDKSTITFKTTKAFWTPKAGLWPKIENRCLMAKSLDNTQPYALDFTPIRINENGRAEVAMIPPGEYTLYMGFAENKTTAQWYDLKFFVNGTFIAQKTMNRDFNVDRGKGSYPEGYSEADKTGYTDANSYDRDGTEIGKVTIEGEGLQSFVIRVESVGPLPKDRQFDGHHWCLKPTSNNY